MTVLFRLRPAAREANMAGRPTANTRTPSICSNVVSRKIQSSVS
jgi:hypothetical protein